MPPSTGKTIAFLSSHAGSGGTTNYVQMIKRHLSESGHYCTAVAVEEGEHPRRDIFDTIIACAPKSTPIEYLRNLARTVAHLRNIEADVVIGVMPMANVLAGLCTFRSATRAIATHHTPYAADNRLLRLGDRLLGAFGRFSEVVCVSQGVAATYRGHATRYLSVLKVIPNGVRPLTPDEGRATVRQRLGIPKAAPIALMAGRLAHQKNVLNAVKAMQQVPDAVLVLAGDGPQRSEVEALVAELKLDENVILLGQVDRQTLANLVAESRVFLQVSFFEGMSLALLEAATLGIPSVVSDIPEQREVLAIDGRVAGLLCDPADHADIARALRRLLFDEETRSQVLADASMLRDRVPTEDSMLAQYAQLVAAIPTRRTNAQL